MSRRVLSVAVVFAWTIATAFVAARAQQVSIWDGVYTAEQAKRGAAVYKETCEECHLKDLEGDGSSPSLSGEHFMKTWNGSTLNALSSRIRNGMPDDDPGILTDEQSADSLAYILSFNKLPQGKAELAHDAESLKNVRFDSAKKQVGGLEPAR